MFSRWENGGSGWWNWPTPKSLLWLPQHGSWGEVGSGGRTRRRRRWRSIEAAASCEFERGQIQLLAGQRLRHTPNSKPWKQSRNIAVAKREQWGQRSSNRLIEERDVADAFFLWGSPDISFLRVTSEHLKEGQRYLESQGERVTNVHVSVTQERAMIKNSRWMCWWKLSSVV